MKTLQYWVALSAALVVVTSRACDNAARVAPSTQTGIVIRPLATSLQEGDTAQLQVDVKNSAGATASSTVYLWSSSNPNFVSISPTGMVLAIWPSDSIGQPH